MGHGVVRRKFFYALGGGNGLRLPIGISFYTFQSLSYLIDVYRGKSEAQNSIINTGLYISFFPQLVAGPIVRYDTIATQLTSREHSFKKFSDGVERFCIGLAKKVLVADQVMQLANLAFSQHGSDLSAALAWGGMVAYTIQVYFDFSGYSDMAIGLGKMFGFEFRENFNYPYISRSISEYWRRWHISLGEWFRDYLYYPLSLGFAVKVRRRISPYFSKQTSLAIANGLVLFIVWLATGLWHGANMTFVVWGLSQFAFIFYEQHRKPRKETFMSFVKTFAVVMVVKVISRSDTLTYALDFYRSMLGLNSNPAIDNVAAYWLSQYKIAMMLGFVFMFPTVEKLNDLARGSKLAGAWEIFKAAAMVALFVMSAVYAIGGNYNPFIYFDF